MRNWCYDLHVSNSSVQYCATHLIFLLTSYDSMRYSTVMNIFSLKQVMFRWRFSSSSVEGSSS